MLLVLYFFEAGEAEPGGSVNQAIDRRLNGVIQGLRQRGGFSAQLLETLVITPLPYSIRPRRLLLIGLGKPKTLSPELLNHAGRVVIREALRLGVREYSQSFEPHTDINVGDAVRSLLEGTLAGQATEKELQSLGLADEASITNIRFLVSPGSYQETLKSVKQAFNQHSSKSAR